MMRLRGPKVHAHEVVCTNSDGEEVWLRFDASSSDAAGVCAALQRAGLKPGWKQT